MLNRTFATEKPRFRVIDAIFAIGVLKTRSGKCLRSAIEHHAKIFPNMSCIVRNHLFARWDSFDGLIVVVLEGS